MTDQRRIGLAVILLATYIASLLTPVTTATKEPLLGFSAAWVGILGFTDMARGDFSFAIPSLSFLANFSVLLALAQLFLQRPKFLSRRWREVVKVFSIGSVLLVVAAGVWIAKEVNPGPMLGYWLWFCAVLASSIVLWRLLPMLPLVVKAPPVA